MMINTLKYLLIIFSFELFHCDIYDQNKIYDERIQNCVHEKLQNEKTVKTVKSDIFALHYGDPGVEVFNVLNNKNIRAIEYLNQCVINIDNSLFINRLSSLRSIT